MEPRIEKYPHPLGVIYAWVHDDRVLGSVTPYRDQAHPKAPKAWRATVGQREVGVFVGKRGRVLAMRAVQHFSKHLWYGVERQLVANWEWSA